LGTSSDNVLWQEELDLLVRKLAQLGAEHIVDADVICISPGSAESVSGQLCGRMYSYGQCEAAGRTQLWLSETHARYATVREGSWLK
jgi:hypothetical protein